MVLPPRDWSFSLAWSISGRLNNFRLAACAAKPCAMISKCHQCTLHKLQCSVHPLKAATCNFSSGRFAGVQYQCRSLFRSCWSLHEPAGSQWPVTFVGHRALMVVKTLCRVNMKWTMWGRHVSSSIALPVATANKSLQTKACNSSRDMHGQEGGRMVIHLIIQAMGLEWSAP